MAPNWLTLFFVYNSFRHTMRRRRSISLSNATLSGPSPLACFVCLDHPPSGPKPRVWTWTRTLDEMKDGGKPINNKSASFSSTPINAMRCDVRRCVLYTYYPVSEMIRKPKADRRDNGRRLLDGFSYGHVHGRSQDFQWGWANLLTALGS